MYQRTIRRTAEGVVTLQRSYLGSSRAALDRPEPVRGILVLNDGHGMASQWPRENSRRLLLSRTVVQSVGITGQGHGALCLRRRNQFLACLI